MSERTTRPPRGGESRRDFARQAALAAAAASAFPAAAWAQDRRVTIFVLSDAPQSIVERPPVSWAVEQLRRAFQEAGQPAAVRKNLGEIHQAGQRIVVASGTSAAARQLAERAGVSLPNGAESLALVAGKLENEPVLLVSGPDVRGLVYGILELVDRIQHAPDPAAELRGIGTWIEQPVNSVRSIARLFVSNVEDKPWFYDQSFWRDYLTMLMAQRFNRFSLTLGLGYDLPRRVLDSYFIFAYPFLVSVPGYEVTVPGLPAAERERNLATLQWISGEAAARGLHFQLGLWSHTYQWIDSPNANYVIQGLTPATHAPYCRDALRTLLQVCPAIDGITFRAHSESGIPDGSYDFWKTVFSAVGDCGRRVEIDLHSKGIGATQIRMALDTGQPVRVSPKLTAEHMGLPAHQAAIREQERTQASSTPRERSFTRYGYADYLPEDRAYGVFFRIWPGTQKLLLWGDPIMAAGYGRHAGFCGALGLELCEPLTFKGRQGSGQSPERRIYADDSLTPHGGDWRKYLYTYRLWGRHLYDPAAKPDGYRRYLRKEFGPAAAPVEASLGLASRIHPLFTSAHLPSASGLSYWQELYTNLPITGGIPHPFGELPAPRVFSRVSPLDPALFSAVHEFAGMAAGAQAGGRYSPPDVARWLEGFAGDSERQLALARARISNAKDPSFRRLEIDVTACNGFGRFFAQKLRAAVAYSIYEKNGDPDALRDAVYFYRLAREAWAGIVRATRGAYLEDVTFGAAPQLRGNWAGRLPAIDRDLKAIEQLLAGKTGETSESLKSPTRSSAAWLQPRPAAPPLAHRVPATFRAGQPLSIELTSPDSAVQVVEVHYRHVNQAESYQIEKMTADGGRWRHTIPGQFTNSAFPLMYFFEVRDGGGHAWLHPGLEPDLCNQPYYVVRRA